MTESTASAIDSACERFAKLNEDPEAPAAAVDAAFAEIYRSAGPPLMRSAYRSEQLDVYVSPEDTLQDTFLAFWQNREAIDPHQSLRALLYVIYRHRRIDALRRVAGRNQVPLQEEYITANGRTPDQDSLIAGVMIKLIASKLPYSQREAIVLRGIYGCTDLEIAARQGVSPGTAKGRLRLARKAVGAAWDADEPAAAKAAA